MELIPMHRAWRYLTAIIVLVPTVSPVALASPETKTLYVDSSLGCDTNPGTAGEPLHTLKAAALKANAEVGPGPMTIKLAAGIYALPETVVFTNHCAFSAERRLTIEASLLPDEPGWSPQLMPTILSIEGPRKLDQTNQRSSTFGLKIKMSHVTLRGLKFLGSPLLNNYYCPLECLGNGLKDVRVTQCLFVGDPFTLDIYCGVITDGHEFVVEHCVFSGCHACAVFWDGDRGVVGKGNAMQHCIVDGAKLSAVWTCDTDEDFEFHHNVITRSEYFWLRKRGTHRTYRIRDSIVTENNHFSGYGIETGATGTTGPEVRFQEERVLKTGKVVLERDPGARNYLHIVAGTPGTELGAGLFTRAQTNSSAR